MTLDYANMTAEDVAKGIASDIEPRLARLEAQIDATCRQVEDLVMRFDLLHRAYCASQIPAVEDALEKGGSTGRQARKT